MTTGIRSGLGEAVRYYREEYGEALEDVAAWAGLTADRLGQIEGGDEPTFVEGVALSVVVGIDPQLLIDGAGWTEWLAGERRRQEAARRRAVSDRRRKWNAEKKAKAAAAAK